MKTKANSIRRLALTGAATLAMLLAPDTSHGQTIYVTSFNGSNNIGSYNAATGVAIAGYTAPTGNGSDGIALSGNTLFVANYYAGSVGTYDAKTGATLNSGFATLSQVQGVTISGNNLYAASNSGVADFNATSGLAIPAFTLIPGNAAATAVLGTMLFVSDEGNDVGEYNATTGATINASFISGLNGAWGLALSGTHLFVANRGGSNVSEYDALTGALLNANFATGVSQPIGLAVSGNNLYAVSLNSNAVYDFDATTGAPITSGFTSPGGLNGAESIALVPEPSTWAMIGVGAGLLGLTLRQRRARRV